jgi:hypothetical protein
MEHGGGAMSESFGEPRAGQEAAKLLAAAQDWLRTSAPHVAPLDAEGRTCACPLCRIVAGVRDTDPVALGTWVDAAVAAATSALAQAGETLAPSAGSGDGTPADAADDDDEDDDGYAVPTDDLDADDDLDGELGLDDLEGDDVDALGRDAGPPGARTDAAARQDDDRARGVRRIPLEQTDPGDLDG